MKLAISKTTIIQNDHGYELQLNGEPFFINGAGLEFGSIAKLAEHGGNSFRTWRIDNGEKSGKEVLDEAEKYGLKVMMGIEVARERHGFDYNDEFAVKEQLERIKQDVIGLKDHPALIIWGIGNELNLQSTNPKVWDAVNDISKMIHEVDPNHLTTTSLAGINEELVNHIKLRASDIDFLSLQLYAEVIHLPQLLKKAGWDGPFVVSEWGATGYWEVKKTKWGAPIEEHSTEKANHYLKRYKTAILSQKAQCLGSYVFLWGQKQERTPTWFGVFTEEGRETECVDVMHYLWNNTWPENRTPRVINVSLDSKTASDNIKLTANKSYSAAIDIEADDSEFLSYRWNILRESTSQASGGDKEEVPEEIEGLLLSEPAKEIEFLAPMEAGAYRLFIYVDDKAGHTAHANIPFYVR